MMPRTNRCRLGVVVSLLGAVGLGWLYLSEGQVTGGELQRESAELVDNILRSIDAPAGMCVHIGVRDGRLAIDLAHGGKYLVHGLSDQPDAIATARGLIDKVGMRGVVSVEVGACNRLPYADNLVNLLVVEVPVGSSDDELSVTELLRVLRPGGVAWLGGRNLAAGEPAAVKLRGVLEDAGLKDVRFEKSSGLWAVVTKPRSKDLGVWTHKRHDASGNPVSSDKQVGVPTGVRWVTGPSWPTGYRKSAVPAVVASDRRLVYVFQDEVETADGPFLQNSLIARDAYNGLLIWKRKTTKSRAPLVSVGDRIYTVVEDGGPLVLKQAYAVAVFWPRGG